MGVSGGVSRMVAWIQGYRELGPTHSNSGPEIKMSKDVKCCTGEGGAVAPGEGGEGGGAGSGEVEQGGGAGGASGGRWRRWGRWRRST